MCIHRYILSILAILLLSSGGCRHSPTDLGSGEHTYQLVYMLAGGQIFISNDNGTEKRLLTSGFVAKWSPIGDRVAFFGNGNQPGRFICTIKVDGTDFRPLTLATRSGDWLTGSLDWSPDGKKIVFYTTKYHSSGFAVINTDGTNEINLTPEGFWRVVEWSPDGSKIAVEGEPAPVGKRPSIYIVDPNGIGMYNLIDAFAVAPLWRPDGKKIIFDIGTRQDTTLNFQFASYISDPNGSNLQRLTDGGVNIANWSPDRSKMLFLSHSEIGNRIIASVGMMHADGSELKVLLNADEHHGFLFPRFSPNGKKIAYVRVSNAGMEDSAALWVMNADGSEQRKLDGHMEGGPIIDDWSPK
jgi:Tol biopolymer transport system component